MEEYEIKKDKLKEIIKKLSLEQSCIGCSTSKLTSMRTGGEVLGLLNAADIGQLLSIVRNLLQNGINFITVGSGTNIIFSDEKMDLVLIKLGRGFNYFKVKPGDELEVGGAFKTGKLVLQAARMGYDLSFLAGVPGTVGGSVMGNSGDKDTGICRLIKRIHYLSVEHKDGIDSLKNSVLKEPVEGRDYGYRHLNIPGLRVLTAVDIEAKKDDPEKIIKKIKERVRTRRKTQPVGSINSGCIFKNPAGLKESAGRLIDLAGFRGFRYGGAMVSCRHANFIENFKNANSRDVMVLSGIIREGVFKSFNINLEYEIRLIGFEKWKTS